tara:strand:+ start:1982 stop:2395 length:414 start_codon:yes stop_codon:yes gene_type:complete
MGIYAVVEDNKITNVIEWDGNTTTWTPPTGSTMVGIASTEYAGIGIGQSYIDGKFIIPEYVDPTPLSEYYEQVREKRNKKLTGSDWTQYTDSPLDSTKKTEWATYRQALRDLPANLTDSNVKDVIYVSHSFWPTKPS